ncbi:MAG: protein kinase [Chloroflexota bacterium]|nr:protein kinase [Chloroflexota bacterium]
MTESTDLTTNQRDLPGGTVTILFTDIQGSTDLLKRLGNDGYVALILEHHKIMRKAITQWHGAEVRTQGDSFFITFPRAPDAVAAAVDVQGALASQSWSEDVQVLVRMGLHTGQPWIAVDDYEGIDIHRAARIASTGHGGQVLLSETTASLVRDDLPEGVTLKDLGAHRLKDMRRPEQITQLVIPGLPSDFPPIKSLESVPTVTRYQSLRGYELHQPLGTGVFGEVYLAYQPTVRRDVAIKTIVPKYANNPDFIRRFEAEAQVVASLEHPHIVPLYDYWREPDGAYLVMRYLRGGSLEDALTYGPWRGDYAAQLVDQVASGLAYAHRQGVVHRDIKPANILLDEGGNAYLSDFGIATLVGSLQSQLELQVEDDEERALYSGSLGYQSPETADGKPATQLSDIYSLGVVLYQLVTAQPPFPDLSGEALIEAHRIQPLPSVLEQRPDIPAAVDNVIQKATAKDPAQRYPDALNLATAFKQAVLAEAAEVLPVMPLEVENPYKGLRAFQEADAGEFFGRGAMIERLLKRMDINNGDPAWAPSRGRFLAVVGPSGSGKSSLVRAGLVPALRKGVVQGSDCWFILDMIPGAHPFEELEAALLRVAVNPPEKLLGQLQENERGLIRAVKRCLPPDEDIELLLVVDQFEELFTLVQDSEESRRFLDCLYAAVMDPNSRIRVAITLRADFYDRPLMHPDFSELVQEHTEVVVPLTTDELSEAVDRPAESVSARLEPGLTARIVTDVHGEPGALPLLQYALMELFENRDNGTLTQDAYQEIGGVLGALGIRAEGLYQDLDGTAQAAARQLFLRLVTLGEGTVDTRRRVLVSELEALGATGNPTSQDGWSTSVETVIGLFGGHRLLTFDRDPATREPTVEVAHEALLGEWTRLGGWLDESRADVRMQRVLGNAAVEWVVAERDPSFLLRGSRLEQYEGWAASTDLALTADEQAYLNASLADEAARKAQREKLERRSRNVLRALVAVFAVAAVFAVVLSLFAFNAQREANEQAAIALNEANQRATAQAVSEEQAEIALEQQAIAEEQRIIAEDAQQEAEEKRIEAEKEREKAEEQTQLTEEQRRLAIARELALSANANLEADPERSVLLAMQSISTTRTLEGVNALHRALPELHLLKRYPVGESGQGVAFSPDGDRIVAASNAEPKITVLDFSSGDVILEIETEGVHWDVKYSPDGSMIAASGTTGTNDLTIWDSETGEVIQSWISQEGALTSLEGVAGRIAFSPDGEMLAVASVDGIPRILDISTGEIIQSFHGHSAPAIGLAYSKDGALLATGNHITGELIVWNPLTAESLLTLETTPGDKIHGIAINPNGEQIAAAGDEGLIKVWSLPMGDDLLNIPVETSGIRNLIYTHDGKHIVSGGQDSTARLWNANTGELVTTLAGHTSVVMGLSLSPDGDMLATGGYRDEEVRLWDLAPGGELFNIQTQPGSGFTGNLSPDGKWLVAIGPGSTINRYDPKTGVYKDTLANLELEPGDFLVGVAFSPDGKKMALGSINGSIYVLNYPSGELLMTLEGHAYAGISSQFSPDGSRLLSNGFDTRAFVWDLSSGSALTEYTEHKDIVAGSCFIQDGELVATASLDGSVRVWDAETGETLHTLPIVGCASSVELTPDGKTLVAGSCKGEVIGWDVETRQETVKFKAHQGTIFDLDFNAEGTQILTAGFEGGAKVFDFPSGEEVATLFGHKGNVTQVLYGPDDKIAYTSAWDWLLHAFVLDNDDLIALAQSRLTRGLTGEECRQFLHLESCP